MDYQSINSRDIVVPELGLTLHLSSIELPEIMKGLDPRNSEDVDRKVSVVCQEVFRVGPTDIISFTEWTRTTNQIRNLLYSYQLRFGEDKAFQLAESGLDSAPRAIGGPGQFLQSMIVNGLLVPTQQRTASSTSHWFQTVATNEEHAPQFFADLATSGVSELGFASWRKVNQFLQPQKFPSSEVVRQEIPEFEVPFAGSKPLTAITIQNFEKLCYGAAALVISETAVSTASAVGHGSAPTLVAVLGGSVSALIFVSVGALSRFLEDYLKSKSSLSNAPTTSKTRGKRAAAA